MGGSSSTGQRLSAAKLPSIEDVEGWQSECARIDAEILSLQAQRDAYSALIKGAQALFPFVSVTESRAPAVAPNQPDAESPKRRGRPPRTVESVPTTWTGIM